jgi:hypothetical protein
MEFRGKLLALLPLTSGTGIFLLLVAEARTAAPQYLVAVGIFGLVVTLGLYFYELYSIRWCDALFDCGIAIEKRLFQDMPAVPSYGAGLGPFRMAPKEFGGLVSARGAALIIYPATMGAWAYLALAGGNLAASNSPLVWMVPLLVMLVFLLAGGVAIRRVKSAGG